LKNYPLPVIADEVFLDFPLKEFPASFSSFASRNETLTFTLSGVSKILGLPQMKLSWIVVTGPDTLRKQAIEKLEIISDTYLSVSTPIQNALPLLLSEGLTIQTEILKRIRSNYLYLQQTLNGKPHLSLLENQGGWVAVLKCSDQRTDEEWSVELLEKDFILTHPGFFYDFMEGSHLVISLLTPTEILREACPRILRRTGNI
jgi:aspartate/methionine/tyrosine aminotransferase